MSDAREAMAEMLKRNGFTSRDGTVIQAATFGVIDAILALSPSPQPSRAMRWFLASQNDGLFIINAEPRPSNDDQWHDRPNGPSIVLNVTELPEAKAIKIVGVMNELLSPQPSCQNCGAAFKSCAKCTSPNSCEAADVAASHCTRWKDAVDCGADGVREAVTSNAPAEGTRETLAELLRHWERATAKVQYALMTKAGNRTRESNIVGAGLANVRAKTIDALSARALSLTGQPVAADDGTEPFLWICLVPGEWQPENIRAWTRDPDEAASLIEQGLNMKALYALTPPECPK